MKLEISNRKRRGKHSNTWKVNNTILNNSWVKEEASKEFFFKYRKLNENKTSKHSIGNSSHQNNTRKRNEMNRDWKRKQ